MRLSTRTRYGCRAMAELAAAYPEKAPSVREIAERQRLSPKYLEHIMQALKLAGLVRVTRGMRGGYALARAPQKVKVAEVFRALEGSPAPVLCVDAPETCSMARGCPTRGTWVELRDAIEHVLEGKTLQDLGARCRGRRAQAVPPATALPHRALKARRATGASRRGGAGK